MTDEIEEIDLRRLTELRKQAALLGPHTDPAILIEIQDLNNKHAHPGGSRATRSSTRTTNDYDLLLNIVASGLQRLTMIEQQVRRDASKRITRQLIHDIWMIFISVIALVNLILLLSR